MMLKLHWINHWTIMHIVHMETLTYFTDPIIPNSKVNISKVLTQFQDSTVPREQRNIVSVSWPSGPDTTSDDAACSSSQMLMQEAIQ